MKTRLYWIIYIKKTESGKVEKINIIVYLGSVIAALFLVLFGHL